MRLAAAAVVAALRRCVELHIARGGKSRERQSALPFYERRKYIGKLVIGRNRSIRHHFTRLGGTTAEPRSKWSGVPRSRSAQQPPRARRCSARSDVRPSCIKCACFSSPGSTTRRTSTLWRAPPPASQPTAVFLAWRCVSGWRRCVPWCPGAEKSCRWKKRCGRWAERAEGVCLSSLITSLPRQTLLRMLDAVPHEAVRDAVLLDVLTMQTVLARQRTRIVA